MLALALLAGGAPVGSLSLASASECSMSCCIGLPSHRPGECDSVLSCHVELPQHTEASDAPEAEQVEDTGAPSHHAQGDSDDAEHHQAQTPTATQTDASAASSPQTAQPPDKQKPRRHAVIARPALVNPCPPDCGVASSFVNVLRSRDAATLTGAHRARPPTRVFARAHAFGLPLKFSAGKYRLAPPRAPPAALNSTPA